MQLDDRSIHLMEEIVSKPGMRSKELEEKYNLSRRQIGYSVDKINDWLKANQLPAIEKNRQGVFIANTKLLHMFKNQKKPTKAHTYVTSESERVHLILLLLLGRSEALSLVHLTSALAVSKNTVLSDLKITQKSIEAHHLEIVYSRQLGYRIEGAEFDKRKLLSEVVGRILRMYDGARRLNLLGSIADEEIQRLKQRLETIEHKLNLRFTDEKLDSAAYTLLLILRRMRQNKIVGSFHIDYRELSDTNEYKAVEELLVDAEHIPKEERLFLTLQLLTASVSSSTLLTDKTIPKLIEAIREMLNRFENQACIAFADKNPLIKKILLHVKPAYYRIKYKLTLSNTLQESFIRETLLHEFREIHRLLRSSIQPLEQLIGCEIPEEERIYITLLVGGWIKRQEGSTLKRVKALVVCPNGVSISKLLQVTLKELFPEFLFTDAISVREFAEYQQPCDLVFSSVYLNTDKKLYIINPVLEQKEKLRVRRQVMREMYGYSLDAISMDHVMRIIEKNAVIKDPRALHREMRDYLTTGCAAGGAAAALRGDGKPELHELLTPEMITLDAEAKNWEEAISLASEPLLHGGCIKPSYAEAILARYRRQFPYIIFGSDIAIPHGVPEDGVDKVAMSLVRLKSSVRFLGQPIRLIVMVAAVDRERHLRALLQLAKLAEHKQDVKRILRAGSKQEIRSILEKYTDESIGNEE